MPPPPPTVDDAADLIDFVTDFPNKSLLVGVAIWIVPLLLAPLCIFLVHLPYVRRCNQFYRVRFPDTWSRHIEFSHAETQGLNRNYRDLTLYEQPMPELEAMRRKMRRKESYYVVVVLIWAGIGWIIPAVLAALT